MCQVGNQGQKELELLGAIANFRKEEKVAEMEIWVEYTEKASRCSFALKKAYFSASSSIETSWVVSSKVFFTIDCK